MTHTSQQGFTLVETLVAIFILVMSITGPLFIAQQSFTSAATARDRTVASFLAQEGVEYIRSVRDHNFLSGNSDWLDGLSFCISSDCTIDASVSSYPSIASCVGTCEVLRKTTTGLYGYRNGVTTLFMRRISITQVQSHEISVEVQVSWEYKGTTRSVTVEERLFNWL
ncbi:prepilin-type N-terminal cleavage/methylation domain-containing protein [Candidatus Wolfebacteria bacterium]|nr:prepilin-type N-terminal cleavage/methylation domain-containing protein [Candidatus Wolfebacteria bacterium]